MRNNFTPRAQRILVLARKEADRLNHRYVTTEHLLLGLLKLGQGGGVGVLQRMGIDLEKVRFEVEKQIGSGFDTKTVGNIPLTEEVKKVLALAGKEAKSFNHSYVGTEHILLGLLQNEGVAGNVLRSLEVDIMRTRNEILRELNPHFASGTSEQDTAIGGRFNYTKRGRRQTYGPFQWLHRGFGKLILHAQSGFAVAHRQIVQKFVYCGLINGRRITPRARSVLTAAKRHIRGSRSLARDVIFFQILELEESTAVKILLRMGFTRQMLGTQVESNLKGHRANSPPGRTLAQMVQLAFSEGWRIGHAYLGTEHLLLSIIRDEEEARETNSDGVSLSLSREEVIREFSSPET